MARQLVFTSAPQGLTPGRTGYGTVARHQDLRDRLAAAVESLSLYPEGWQPAPVVCTFRLVDLGGTRFPVLSRIVHAGLDYTHRGHFLAHHLVLEPEEITGAPPPAEVFRRWPGWLNRWDGPPRWLEEKDLVDLPALRAVTPPALPAETWARLTGDAGHAALLVEGLSATNRVLRCPVEREGMVLDLLSEASALLPPVECWRTEFTTCLQPSDPSSAFRWAIVRAGSPGDTGNARSGGVLDLARASTLPTAPENALSRRARGMTPAPAPAPAAPAIRTPVAPVGKILGDGKISRPVVPILPPIASPSAAQKQQSQAWIFGAIGGTVVGGLVLAIVFWPQASAPPPATAANTSQANGFTAPKAEAVSTEPAKPAATLANQPKIIPPPANTVANNQQTLTEIRQLAATEGQGFAALTRWRELVMAAPDFAAAHTDVLNAHILPNARKQWLAQLDQITADLGTGKTSRADLTARLATLRSFPHDWPVAQPDELDKAANTTASILAFANKLPDAPVWVVDNLASESNSHEYNVGNTTLAIPELNALLADKSGKFHVSAAAATSLQPPAADQWFNFNILPVDFEAGKYLVLHDASRGEAGGRLMQLTVDTPGQVKFTWRMFAANTAFFQRFPANAPLRPTSRELWLHFAGEPPLPSFYLLVRRLGDVTEQNWKPLSLPLAWLSYEGTPAEVHLPSWLANNLVLHTPGDEPFYLVPMNLSVVVQSVTVAVPPAHTPDEAKYHAAWLVEQLEAKYRLTQTDKERAQQELDKMQSSTDPARTPPRVMLNQATQTVRKLEGNLIQLQNAAQAAGKPLWPLSVSPWLLYYNRPDTEPMTLLQFTANETGPTP